jgi:predicted AlkP superfamily phosphohydrolase/phosphomutase
LFILTDRANAYIDPGTGFTLFSLGGWLIAALAGLIGIFSLFFKKIMRFIKKQKKLFIIIIILIALILVLLILGVLMNNKKSDFDNKMIILGFDGLNPEIVESMMKKNELPNFSKLSASGDYRKLATTNPSQSPVAWAGFATGQNPGKNGMFDFITRNPENYGLQLSLSSMVRGKPQKVIKSKCFWEYTSEEKIPTTVISCPVTYPPDKIYGRMLSGMGVTDILGTEGTFTFYTSEPDTGRKDVGGKVFHINKSSVMVLNFIGPRISGLSGKTENVKIPFKVVIKDKNTVSIKYQDTDEFELKAGQWSGWQDISFSLGFLRKAKGIFKFHLVGIEPDFKLYISPINFDPRNSLFPVSSPKGFSKDLVERIGLFYTQGMPLDTWAVNENRLGEEAFIEQLNDVIREKKAILNSELDRFKEGIFFCYFGSSDIVQHMFWRYIDPKHPLYEKNAPKDYREMINIWYKKLDIILGSVMERLNEEDVLLVLSDHGFNTFRRSVHLNTWLRKNGYLELTDPSASEGAELLEDIDWYKTKAYALGFGAIYINQEGRETNGIVKPGRDTEQLKDELTKKLKKWRDDKYKTNIIHEIYQKEDIFWGDHVNDMPDIYVGFNAGYRASWQTALGSVPETMIEDNLKKWSGSHLCDPNLVPGVLFSNKKLVKDNPSIYDITPTILGLIGYDKDRLKLCNLDGEPLF